MAELADDMRDLRAETKQLQQQHRDEREAISEHIEQLRQEVAAELAAMRSQLADWRDSGQARRQEAIQELVSGVSTLRKETTETLNELRDQRLSMTDQHQDQRKRAVAKAGRAVDQLRDQTGQLREMFAEELGQAADTGRTTRRQELEELRSEVETLRQQARDFLGRMRTEMESIRRPDKPDAPVERPTDESSEESSSASSEENREEATPASEASSPPEELAAGSSVDTLPDYHFKGKQDLKQISGIGPSTESALAESGVENLADIVNTPDEKLEDYLGDLARFSNIDYWKRQAAELLEEQQD